MDIVCCEIPPFAHSCMSICHSRGSGLLPNTRLLRRCASRNDKDRILVSLRAIRRIARQSQPSLLDFFNRPESGNPLHPLRSWIPASAGYMFSRPLAFATIPKACGFEAATRFPSILSGGSLIQIVVCGEAILALFSIRGRDALATLHPAGILPAAENKGKMPSPHGNGFPMAKHVFHRDDSANRSV